MKKKETAEQKSSGSLLYSIKSYFSVQANVLIVLFAVLLLVLTIYPMYSVIRSAVTVGNMDSIQSRFLLVELFCLRRLSCLNAPAAAARLMNCFAIPRELCASAYVTFAMPGA